ncbi:MAG: hypothetical protein ACFCUU_16355 [Cyclobacteriaceae bacterium]
MRILRVLLFLFCFSFFSCEKNEIGDPLIDSYSYIFMDYPSSIMPSQDYYNFVDVVYTGGRVVKRVGGLIPLHYSTGYKFRFTNKISDIVSCKKGIIEITKESAFDDIDLMPETRTLYINNSNNITRKILNKSDTLDFKYNSKGQIIESSKLKGGKIELSKFYFNVDNNLDSIVTFNLKNGKKTIEIFKEYDNNPNPLKHLVIFDETFHRSLSKNNYTEYVKEVYDSNNINVGQSFKKWTLTYTVNGYPSFK